MEASIKARIEQIEEAQVKRRESLAFHQSEYPGLPSPDYISEIDFLLSLVKSQEADTFAAGHFSFGPCVHSMVKPDCPSCCQSHAIRMEQQLGKLEASTALPERERIEKALREHMAHCYQVYKGVPPTVNDWIGGALHYVMWGLDQDVPLAPDAAASMRSACVEKVRVMKVDYRDRAKVADSEQDNIAQLILLHKATAANEIINALESLSIEKPKE